MTVNIDLSGKKGVIWGVANQRSIAWAIAQKLIDAGADIAFTYQNDRLRSSIEKATSGLNDPILLECDATDDLQVEKVYKEIQSKWKKIDFIVHSVAYAEREDLGGNFSDTNLHGFRTALEASAYTLMSVTKNASHLFSENGGSIITMTFDASVRVYPGYNIMGTAKAAL